VAVSQRRWRLVRARRDAIPASVRRLQVRSLWRGRAPVPSRRWGVKPFVYGGLVLALLAGLGWVVFGTSVLAVRRVEVTGADLAGSDQVRAVAAVTLGVPLARVDTDGVRARVRTLPTVADVDVHRSWPSTLVIDVTERTPVAVVAVHGDYAVLDATGFVFTTLHERPAGVPEVSVAAPGPQDPPTLAALRVLAALTPQLRGKLVRLDAPSPSAITLNLGGGRVVVWGDPVQSELKAQLATALLSRSGNRIDVSAPDAVTVT
jgi:cell division protein FtsQ